jgi:hypothetical protein
MSSNEGGVVQELTRQLVAIMNSRLLDPLEIVFDQTVDDLRARAEQAAAAFAARLLGADDQDAAWAAATLIGALYPSDTAFNPPPDWWRTPLGRAVLRRMGHPSAETVPYAVAGAMLGITRQGVHDLVVRGKLSRHPDGGVTVASVREREVQRS